MRKSLILIACVLFLAIALSPTVLNAEARSARGRRPSGTLYAVGHGIGYSSQGLPHVPARIAALDRATLREKFAFDALAEACLSIDGASLYLAGIDGIRRVDSETGVELWRMSPPGPTNNWFSRFWVSPKGSLLYFPRDYYGNDVRPSWIQIVDTANRDSAPRYFELPLGTYSVLSPSAGTFFYVVCGDRVLAVGSSAHGIEWDDRIAPLDRADTVCETTIAEDGQSLYLYTARGALIRYETKRRRFSTPVPPIPRLSSVAFRGTFLGLSGNGKNLVIAQNIGVTPGKHNATQLRVIDTRSWRTVSIFSIPVPIASLTIDTDGKKIYSVVDRYLYTTEHHLNDTFVEIDMEQAKISREYVRRGEHLKEILLRE